MKLIEAQEKISRTIIADPERIILMAIEFAGEKSRFVAEAAEDASAAHGPRSGVAAIALRYALQGENPEKVEKRLIEFAALL